MYGNLLIIGAGGYALVAMEIAQSMGCFERIAFADDRAQTTPDGQQVIGTTEQLERLVGEYPNVAVAIGNPEVRQHLFQKLSQLSCTAVSLISPRAYVSPSARIAPGCIVEPMAVVHTGCKLEQGCIVSAGAVVNHYSTLSRCVHIDCNATVAGYCEVPAGTKVASGEVYKK